MCILKSHSNSLINTKIERKKKKHEKKKGFVYLGKFTFECWILYIANYFVVYSSFICENYTVNFWIVSL